MLECPVPIEPLQEALHWHERHQADRASIFMRQVFAEAAPEVSAPQANHAGEEEEEEEWQLGPSLPPPLETHIGGRGGE